MSAEIPNQKPSKAEEPRASRWAIPNMMPKQTKAEVTAKPEAKAVEATVYTGDKDISKMKSASPDAPSTPSPIKKPLSWPVAKQPMALSPKSEIALVAPLKAKEPVMSNIGPKIGVINNDLKDKNAAEQRSKDLAKALKEQAKYDDKQAKLNNAEVKAMMDKRLKEMKKQGVPISTIKRSEKANQQIAKETNKIAAKTSQDHAAAINKAVKADRQAQFTGKNAPGSSMSSKEALLSQRQAIKTVTGTQKVTTTDNTFSALRKKSQEAMTSMQNSVASVAARAKESIRQSQAKQEAATMAAAAQTSPTISNSNKSRTVNNATEAFAASSIGVSGYSNKRESYASSDPTQVIIAQKEFMARIRKESSSSDPAILQALAIGLSAGSKDSRYSLPQHSQSGDASYDQTHRMHTTELNTIRSSVDAKLKTLGITNNSAQRTGARRQESTWQTTNQATQATSRINNIPIAAVTSAAAIPNKKGTRDKAKTADNKPIPVVESTATAKSATTPLSKPRIFPQILKREKKVVTTNSTIETLSQGKSPTMASPRRSPIAERVTQQPTQASAVNQPQQVVSTPEVRAPKKRTQPFRELLNKIKQKPTVETPQVATALPPAQKTPINNPSPIKAETNKTPLAQPLAQPFTQRQRASLPPASEQPVVFPAPATSQPEAMPIRTPLALAPAASQAVDIPRAEVPVMIPVNFTQKPSITPINIEPKKVIEPVTVEAPTSTPKKAMTPPAESSGPNNRKVA
jgi:hypothetical protein